MFRRQPSQRGRVLQIVEMFRAKGATTPEKAMISQELGLPPRFDEAMDRSLGQLGLFVKVGDKYYLSEERLKAIEGSHLHPRRRSPVVQRPPIINGHQV